MLIVGIAMLGVGAVSTESAAVLPFLMVWIAFVGFGGYQTLRMPHTIRWRSDDAIEFESRISLTRTSPAEIRSIKPGGSNIGHLEIRLASKKLLILNQFDGFHEFLSELKRANPDVTLRGC